VILEWVSSVSQKYCDELLNSSDVIELVTIAVAHGLFSLQAVASIPPEAMVRSPQDGRMGPSIFDHNAP